MAEVFAEGDAKEIQKWMKKANLKSMLDEKAPITGKTALHLCVEKGQLEYAQQLIKAGAAVNTLDARGWGPLHHAALNVHTDCTCFVFAVCASVALYV